MLQNYFRIAWRNMVRNKMNSLINIAGLAIGMAGVVLITLYVQDELKFDRFFSKADRIYQLNLDARMGTDEWIVGRTPPPVGAALAGNVPGIETYTRVYETTPVVLGSERAGKKQYFTERNVIAVDSNFLQVFDYPVLAGDPATCLMQPSSIVLTESLAKKHFGYADAIGKTVSLDRFQQPFTVSAVLRDPVQSTLKFDLLLPMSAMPSVKQFSWSWVWTQMNTFMLLEEKHANPEGVKQIEAAFPAVVRTSAASAFRRIGKPYDELKAAGGRWDFRLQPLTDVHLYSDGIGNTYTTLSSIRYVYIFSTIALFIIILACVNYMNLSTARASRRMKEIGVRKVLGSDRRQLIRQFLTESMICSFAAAIIAAGLVLLALPWFNALSGKSLSVAESFSAGTWLLSLGLVVLTGLLAGSYPAFYLTSFQAVEVLKGKMSFRKRLGGLFVRNGLVVFQFTVSVALIICTIVVFSQLRYSQSKEMGLNKNNVLVLPNLSKIQGRETFCEELARIPGVSGAGIATGIPTVTNFTDGYVPEQGTEKETLAEEIPLTSFLVDEQFIPALQIKLLAGRNFSKDFNDSASVILNEEAAKAAGWKDPVGKFLQYPGNSQRFQVIGVVKNFDLESVHNPMIPFALFHRTSDTYDIGVWYGLAGLQPGQTEQILKQVESKWKAFAPAVPFEYSFLDEQFEAMYASEKRMGTVFSIFTGLSIAVGCLGLFGLSVYTAERRTKEIGIRKVLGAGAASIVTSLSKDFVRLVLLSIVIASPLAWLAMNKWLENFAYRISISWWMFALAGAAVLLIALATVSVQAIRAALADPVKSLRTE